MNVPDQELITLMRQGDENAFALLFDRYRKDAMTLAFIRLRDEEKAKDVVQEVFVNVWKKRQYVDEKRPILPYIRQSVRNRCQNFGKMESLQLRKQSEYVRIKDTLDNPADKRITDDEIRKAIDAAIDTIKSPVRKRIFEMKYLEDMSVKQIAKDQQLSEGTVKNQISRALQILRPYLKKVHFGMLLFFIHIV